MAEIIKYLNHKVNGNSISYPIGTEPRFIDSILNNNSRNLEEQLLLGNNCKITTEIKSNQYIVTKEFKNSEETPSPYFLVVSKYNILNTNLLLYIVIDERDGNYTIKTANRLEECSGYGNGIITLADNNIYTLKNLNLNNSTDFDICTEELRYGSKKDINNSELIRTKMIKGNINKDSNIFTTYITIS